MFKGNAIINDDGVASHFWTSQIKLMGLTIITYMYTCMPECAHAYIDATIHL